MQQVLGRGGFSIVTLVEHPGGRVGGKEVMSPTPDNLRRMSLELHLLDGARKDRVPNVLWGLSTQIEHQQGVITIDMEWADRLTLKEYIHNHPFNYISPEFVQWAGLQAARGLGWLHGRHILHADLKTSNLFVFSGAQEPLVKIGDLGSSLCLDAFGVDSAPTSSAAQPASNMRPRKCCWQASASSPTSA